MKTINESKNQNSIESSVSFDQDSRESYFEMLEQAFINLSLVDNELVDLEELVRDL